MAKTAWNAGEIIGQFGGHPIRELGIDLEACGGIERWLVASCLFVGRVPEQVSLSAFRALDEGGFTIPLFIAKQSALEIESLLLSVNYPTPDTSAYKLWRVCETLCDRHGGSLSALVAEADGLEELAARISKLAAGFGASAVAGFLRPLRDHWSQAQEIPLHPAALAAACHLGLIAEGQDSEGEPGALRAALLRDPSEPSLADAEFALTRLGKQACLRNATKRCLLGAHCPALPSPTQ
jgi:hypothetical protein